MLHKKINRQASIFPLIVLALLILVFLSAMIGRYFIPPRELLNIISLKFTGLSHSVGQSEETVVFQVRLARICAAMIIGGALSVSGASYQGIFRNPMVSPDILGASAGASFGAVLAILMGLNSFFVQAFAFVCGILAVVIALVVSNAIVNSEGGSIVILVLTGMVVSALFSAFVSIVKYVADPYNTLPAITFWLMGGLTYVTNSDVLIMIIPFLLGVLPLMFFRWKLNILSFGDEEAKSLGINTKELRTITILCATLMTSSSVAIGGMVGWVGLIVPHLARMIVGPDHKRLLPASLLIGSMFLLLVDDISRCAFAQEIPLGIITAVAGAPLFLYLLFKGRRSWT